MSTDQSKPRGLGLSHSFLSALTLSIEPSTRGSMLCPMQTGRRSILFWAGRKCRNNSENLTDIHENSEPNQYIEYDTLYAIFKEYVRRRFNFFSDAPSTCLANEDGPSYYRSRLNIRPCVIAFTR